MKKFLLRVSVFIIYAFILQVVFPFVVDPFHVFRVDDLTSNGITPNGNYIKMRYILANPDKFDGFIFGSSRVGAIHVEKMTGERIYNMTYSTAIPAEHLGNIKTFLANNIHPKRIYIGLDNISYIISLEDRIKQPMSCPYEYLVNDKMHFYSLYLNPSDTIQALFIMLSNDDKDEKDKKDKSNTDIFLKYGWGFPYNKVTKYNWNKQYYRPFNAALIDFVNESINNALIVINELVKLCRENNIELVLFTNPLQKITYKEALDKNYLVFLEGLANITDFYNFSGFNNITLDNNNYLDWSHYTAEIGDMIINVICNGVKYPELNSQGFGVKVTRDNVKDLIRLLTEQAANFKQNNIPGI